LICCRSSWNAQHVGHVAPAQGLAHVEFHPHAQVADVAGQQRDGAAHHHLGALLLEGKNVGQGHPRMQDVTDDGHPPAAHLAELLADGKTVEQGLRGVFVGAVAGIDDVGPDVPGQEVGRPGLAWRITIMSTFMARMLLTVSSSVSPFLTELEEEEKLMTSAERRFWASSNERRVRVEFSKKTLAMVTSRSEGTFLIGRLSTSLNVSAVCRINWMSALVRFLIPSRCFTLS
jgi:hypothetical protein